MTKVITLSQLLAGGASGAGERGRPTPHTTSLDTYALIAKLQQDAARLDEPHDFQPGDLVCWKPGLEIHSMGPQPYIFRRYLRPEEIKAGSADPANIYYCEASDCVIGAVVGMKSGDTGEEAERFVEWLAPARRLTAYAGEKLDHQGSA